MPDPHGYRFFADLVLLLHAAIVVFVVGGLIFILIGNLRDWRWVNGFVFRIFHLVAILVVALQAWLGQLCPLTTLEMWLREQGGQSTYAKGFVEHWVQHFLYYEAPFWVFTLAYTLFGVLVATAWWYFPPRRTWHRSNARGA